MLWGLLQLNVLESLDVIAKYSCFRLQGFFAFSLWRYLHCFSVRLQYGKSILLCVNIGSATTYINDVV